MLREMSPDRRLLLSQAEVARERDQVLKKRWLLLWGFCVWLFFRACFSAIVAQQLLWSKLNIIALSGPESSIIVPILISVWFLVFVFLGTRRMKQRPSSKRWFECMLLFNLTVGFSHFIVAVGIAFECYSLGFRFVGNGAPVVGGAAHLEGHRRIGALVILHYYTSILELVDTFFLIARKKIGKSLTLHVAFRVHHVWNWYIAARFSCGGDCYFPLCVSAAASGLLHFSYAQNLLRFHDVRELDLFKFVNKVKLFTFWPCLFFGMSSFIAGSVPRWISLVQVAEMSFGIVLFSNFYEAPKEPSISPKPDATLRTFSFDSSGWCFVYHWGAAMWLQDHYRAQIERGEFAFSGSSGGGLVACCLSLGMDLNAVVDDVTVEVHQRCRHKPWRIPGEVTMVLERRVPPDAHVRASDGRLRILMTRLQVEPPFVKGEVANEFHDRSTLIHCLSASSQIPVIFGLPYFIPAKRSYYIDGLLWVTSFVPWRSVGNSPVCRVSAFNNFGSNVGPKLTAFPLPWWPLFAPSHRLLRGMLMSGYCDMAAHFETLPRDSSSPVPDPQPRFDMREAQALAREYEEVCSASWIVIFIVCTSGTVAFYTLLGAFYLHCFYAIAEDGSAATAFWELKSHCW